MLLVAKNIISDSNLFFYLYNFSQSTTFEYNSSIEHEKYKTNITDKMVEYFYDDENKEKADMPEFLAKGGFRNNIIIVKNFEIQKIKKLPYKDIDGYSVNVQFIIYDKSKENESYTQKLWIG